MYTIYYMYDRKKPSQFCKYKKKPSRKRKKRINITKNLFTFAQLIQLDILLYAENYYS